MDEANRPEKVRFNHGWSLGQWHITLSSACALAPNSFAVVNVLLHHTAIVVKHYPCRGATTRGASFEEIETRHIAPGIVPRPALEANIEETVCGSLHSCQKQGMWMEITNTFKITCDEPSPHWLCADNLKVALESYCKNTTCAVKFVKNKYAFWGNCNTVSKNRHSIV